MSQSQNIYDNKTFFDGYKKLRENPDSANNLEEKPALFSLAPDLRDNAVLDLGCGYGENCAEFLRLGASKVTGVDLSEKMLEIARSENPNIEFIRGDMGDLSFIKEKYDVVFSSLAVHYLEDFDSFSMAELLDNGMLLCGKDVRMSIKKPSYEMLYTDVRNHYETIRKYARTASRSIKSYGWLLCFSISEVCYNTIIAQHTLYLYAPHW